MDKVTLKKELKKMVEEGDEQLLQRMYDAVHDSDSDMQISAEELAEIEIRWERVQKGDASLHSWKEAKSFIINKYGL